MSKFSQYVKKAFSEKVYPNPSDPALREAIEAGIKLFKTKYLGYARPWVLNGEEIYPSAKMGTYETLDPNSEKGKRPTVIGHFPNFDPEHMKLEEHLPRIRAAGRNFFQTVPWYKRVMLLETISVVARERFWLLCAAKAYECGQSIGEQIGETDEEVDFPLVNALYLDQLHEEWLIPTPAFAGDVNGKRYVPHGTFLNICPFNFPGAIPMDMATKALAMGNSFIEKSSPKSSLSGYLVFETIKIAFERMGIEWRGVVNYAPGGADVVNAMLASDEVAGMSFTGSSKVLAEIKKNHGEKLRKGWVGRSPLVYGSAETSGVNVFIVNEDADPVHAALEYVKAFIGRSGQKCSSARVCFVHESLRERFIAAVRERFQSLKYGDVKQGADLGGLATVADAINLEKQMYRMIDTGLVNVICRKRIFETAVKSDHQDTNFPPTVLSVNPMVHDYDSFAQDVMNTEFFGPVSSIVSFVHMDQVERLCGFTDFALTGTIFTDSVDVFAQVLDFIPAGNVYWNRKCTGALVDTECFGGLRSASSPLGIKGKNALALFGSQQTFSGFYPKSATPGEKEQFAAQLLMQGFVLSKC